MASPVLPNPSNFLGVALVVNRSRDGPQFVFHYPPQILPSPLGNDPSRKGEVQDEVDIEDDDNLIDQMSQAPRFGPLMDALSKSAEMQNWNHDDHFVTESGSQIVPWEHVAGFPTRDLESLLTPARAFHKKLFQVSLNQLCYVSYPIFVPEDGIWRRQKKQKREKRPSSRLARSQQDTAGDHHQSGQNGESPGPGPPPDITQTEHRENLDEMESISPEEPDSKKSGMTMFNLVFILSPKHHEVRELIDTLYYHVIKKINKAYKYSQQRNDFVWKESKRILAMKDKGRESKTQMSTLWKEILQVSSLAGSMQEIYQAVSHNKIATLQLETPENTVTHSVQIPAQFYTSDLPPPEDGSRSSTKGLWITTANNFAVDDNLDNLGFLDRNFALLLVVDEKKMISELLSDPDETTEAMAEFVRLSKPTISFHQIGQGNGLSPTQVRKFAQHFIFWRRAIAIPPLHARDVYILSPNCNLDLLPKATQAWAKAFPLAPPLPSFLADLSAAPRPYKWFAPSKNHRPTYLQMLAWLMGGGWVTQLCTFAYVVVWPEIIYEVEYQLEADELKAPPQPSSEDHQQGGAQSTSSPSARSPPPPPPDSTTSASHTAYSSHSPRMSTSSSPSPSPNPYSSNPNSLLADNDSDSDNDHNNNDDNHTRTSVVSAAATAASAILLEESITSNNTNNTTTVGEQVAEAARLERMAEKSTREAAEKAAHHARKPVPVLTDHPSLNEAPHLRHLQPYVVPDAKKATGKESLYLSAIGRRLGGGGGANSGGNGTNKVQRAWPVFWKYFDGRSALERVTLNEDEMKRKEAWALLGAMSEYLVCVRHW